MRKAVEKNINYIYTGKLDVAETIRKIRDSRISKGRYNGHSRYLWRALELRNEGFDNYEIAEMLSVENKTEVTKALVQMLFDHDLIESNPVKDKKVTSSDVILDRELFDAVDLESLKSGMTPAKILLEVYGGKIGNMVYKDKRALRRIWDASYQKYFGKAS